MLKNQRIADLGIVWGLMTVVLLTPACKTGPKVPAVDAYKAKVTLQRFDSDFFAIDTAKLDEGMLLLQEKYAGFLPGFLVNILGVDPASPEAGVAIKQFLVSYKTVQQQADAGLVRFWPALQKDLELGLKLMQHYCKGFQPPSPFIVTSFVGPMDAYEPFATGDYGDVVTANGAGLALQLHLGAQADVYVQGVQNGVFYPYQTRRFEPNTATVNVMKNVINDVFPYPAAAQLNLVEQMVEKGKRLYLLERVLPYTPDSLQLGYTTLQMKGCQENEALIWNFFVKNDLLYTTEPQVLQNYLKDGPKTPELGEGAPGYIGLFVGRQLVSAFMAKHADTSIPKLMAMPAAQVFQASMYKP